MPFFLLKISLKSKQQVTVVQQKFWNVYLFKELPTKYIKYV